jgi:drug/metabolite transporter (DMT)-like permease
VKKGEIPLNQPDRLWANLAIIVAVVLWGLSFVSMKMVMNAGLAPFTMITLRYLIVALFFIMFFRLPKRNCTATFKMDQFRFLMSGVIGITAYFLFEAKGISLTTASSASIIIALVPVFSFMADCLFFKHRTSVLQLLGIILSIAGVYAIFYASLEPFSTASNPLLGNILMLGACFCWVAYSVLSKTLHQRYNSYTITAIQSFYGLVFLVPFALMETPQWIPVTTQAWGHLIYLALFCSVLAYFLYNIALKSLGITVVSVYVNLIPVVGVIGAVLLLSEPLYPIQWMGGIMIVLSLFLVNIKPKLAPASPS